MRQPNLQEEKKLWKKGFKRVVGLDEAGRGALCGPVVAAAVIVNPKFEYRNSKQILNSNFLNSKHVSDFGFRASDLKLRDSKKLTPKARERFYKILTIHPRIKWGIGTVSEKVIDKINILEATKLAMKKAIKNLKNKNTSKDISRSSSNYKKLKIDFLILDGKMKLDLPFPQKSIIKADEKVFSCAMASIIAKVTRDRIMVRYDKKYPKYRFKLHKGYPTKLHLRLLKKYGSCKIHRKSFGPVRACRPK